MQIYLMRHGETDWNKAGRLQGQSDIPLNDFGVELAVKTGEAMADIPFDAAFCSPLQRAVQTAEIILGKREVPLLSDDRLKEINFGSNEGIFFKEAKKDTHNPLYAFFCKPECYMPLEGAESFEQVAERGKAFLQEKILPLEKSCKNVLVVAHGAFNRSLLNPIAGIPLKDFWQIGLPNCAVSILSLENGKLEILEESRVYYGEAVNGRP